MLRVRLRWEDVRYFKSQSTQQKLEERVFPRQRAGKSYIESCAASLDGASRDLELGHKAEGCKSIGSKGHQINPMMYLALLRGVLEFGGNIWGYINVSTILRILRRERETKKGSIREGDGERRERFREAIVNSSKTKKLYKKTNSCDDLYIIMKL